LFQPLDVHDEAEHLRHEPGGFELRRSPDAAVPCGAVPGCAVVQADMPPFAMSDGLLTGRNEIDFTLCEATGAQTLTGTISPNGIVRLRVGVSQITGTPGSCGWSLQFRSVA
jgi:hypothetical protein